MRAIDKAKEYLRPYSPKWIKDHTSIVFGEFITPEILLEFARQMCEEQKIECAKNADAISINFSGSNIPVVDESTVLNAKNVCDI